MIVAEQYLSCDSAIARSTAAAGTPAPVTTKCRWIFVKTFGSAAARSEVTLTRQPRTSWRPRLQDQDDVVGGAGAGAGEHRFHRPRREVAAAAVGRAVHRQQVAAAGLGAERHAVRGQPVDRAFHVVHAPILHCNKKPPTLDFSDRKRLLEAGARRPRADCLLHLLHWWIQPKAAMPWAFFWARGAAESDRTPRAAAYDAAPQSSAVGDTTGMATSARKNTPKRSIELARRLPAEDPDRARLRRRDRVGARPGAGAVGAPRQPGPASSAKTRSRCSASSCAAPTTRWRT